MGTCFNLPNKIFNKKRLECFLEVTCQLDTDRSFLKGQLEILNRVTKFVFMLNKMTSVSEPDFIQFDQMTLHRPTPHRVEDIIKLVHTTTSEEIVNLYKSSTPADNYRCPATTPVSNLRHGLPSGVAAGHRQIFLTQTDSGDILQPSRGKHVLKYYFTSAKIGNSNTQKFNQNPWLDNLCARPVEEIISKSKVQLPTVKGRPVWSTTGLTQGERSLQRAWEQNSTKCRAARKDSSSRGKQWTHPSQDNISDSALSDQLTISSRTTPRYAGHTYNFLTDDKDSSDEDRMEPEVHLEGPVVISCNIQTLPARTGRRDTSKTIVRLPKLKKRKKKAKKDSSAASEQLPTPDMSVDDVTDTPPSVEVKVCSSASNDSTDKTTTAANGKPLSVLDILQST
ncbi:hypothetical protein Btru_000383 [Bulinus truncatus]|nr:hypothetical protein Btru_000383 [Bulinus truncatus]